MLRGLSEVRDKAPAVLLIHEIYGLSDWALDITDELAGAGYVVITPDLLTGMAPGEEARLNWQREGSRR